jgi:hypothetical protein
LVALSYDLHGYDWAEILTSCPRITRITPK